MGIHYDYKSKRGERAVLKEAKRKARLAARRAKRMSSAEPREKDEVKTHDISKTITLESLSKKYNRIPYEYLTAISERVRKEYIYEFQEILLEEPIKSLGNHFVEINLGFELKAKLKIKISAEK